MASRAASTRAFTSSPSLGLSSRCVMPTAPRSWSTCAPTKRSTLPSLLARARRRRCGFRCRPATAATLWTSLARMIALSGTSFSTPLRSSPCRARTNSRPCFSLRSSCNATRKSSLRRFRAR
eukprot:Amastigsp_a179459_26.p3 type:complete len:122 gc:universal Amastigsp_a179459_26:140-505(+)